MHSPLPGRRHLLGLAAGTVAFGRMTMRATAIFPGLSEGYANGDGARLFCVWAGEGPLMLFLHGAPDDWTLYENQLEEFSRDHLVAAPNLRGFPPSDAPEAVEAYAMPRSLGDIHALLRHWGRERCVLIGNDWGGYFAWVFAQGHSILITSGSPICQDTVDVHGVAPKGIGDVVDLVEPQDVEGETAQDGEGDRALADAAGILVHGDVEHVVDAVLHAPVASGRGGIICGAVAVLGRCIPCDFARGPPFPTGRDMLVQNRAGDANRLDGVGLPVVRQVQKAACLEHLDPARFLAITPYLAGLHMAILRLVLDRECFERRFEAWLVALDLEQCLAAGRLHRLDGLDLAMHGIGRAQHLRQAEFAHQRLHRRNFVALHHDGDVPEDDLGAHGERPEQLGYLRLTGRVVAASQALAVMRDHLARAAAERGMLGHSMPAEHRSRVAPSTRPMIRHRVDGAGARVMVDGKAVCSSAKRASMKEHRVL